ncbi:ATP-binding cassette domain-containing protein [Nonomuraea jabiensis]|uniref:ATP-binding cassette domain-containing protein n=1 Tax=Nonomuraea jabiensis TaxID=882448 RepID=UPI0036B04418
MTTKTSAIEAAGLRKAYGDLEVIAGVDLSVPADTVYALLGPNGAGKTTTVRILSTLLPADGGRARVAGYDVCREAERVRASIGVTGQFSAVDELLTGRENLRLMADLRHLDRLRALGVDERIVEVERDGWIPLAAHFPERVPEWVARKREQIADPQLVDFYLTLGRALDWGAEDPRLVELADGLAAYITRMAEEQGEDYVDVAGVEPSFVQVMDDLAFDSAPPARRLIELLKERGWTGWTRLERVDPPPGAVRRSR